MDLDNTNGYARYKCNNGWCAIIYALYFEKGQASLGPGSAGHRHDWEHVVVWVKDNQAEYVWDGTHPKIVYHKDGIGTHACRAANGNDEPPENHYGGWQFRTWSAGTATRPGSATSWSRPTSAARCSASATTH